MFRLVNASRRPLIASATAAACGLGGGISSTSCQGASTKAVHPDSISVFGLGDIPSSAYTQHFTDAHDAAEANRQQRAGAPADAEKRRVRMGVAHHLMTKLGYTMDELEFLGDDVLRMQGVKSPFPLAKLRQGEAVVDLGCGFGPDAFLAASKVGPTGKVTGINTSKEEVQKASERAQERGLGKGQCNFVIADMESTPLDNASVDVVLSNGGFCLCPNKREAFQEVHRVLKPGGRMAISCTVLAKTLPALEGKRWPPCMEVFMPRPTIEQVLGDIGFDSIVVDEKDSTMDAWEFEDKDVLSIAGGLSPADDNAMCSHAKKAAERRAKENVETYLTKDRQAGIHWGNPQFDHIKEFDMNDLCARVTIYAEKKC